MQESAPWKGIIMFMRRETTSVTASKHCVRIWPSSSPISSSPAVSSRDTSSYSLPLSRDTADVGLLPK